MLKMPLERSAPQSSCSFMGSHANAKMRCHEEPFLT